LPSLALDDDELPRLLDGCDDLWLALVARAKIARIGPDRQTVGFELAAQLFDEVVVLAGVRDEDVS
jgi:hypothetical protein